MRDQKTKGANRWINDSDDEQDYHDDHEQFDTNRSATNTALDDSYQPVENSRANEYDVNAPGYNAFAINKSKSHFPPKRAS